MKRPTIDDLEVVPTIIGLLFGFGLAYIMYLLVVIGKLNGTN